ncbi:hypothetical protein MUP05_10890 [Candidatus Bathyarchaeota archaeon]|jgi:hypothetical protein|nr:hypothetical protein [Candidatus Bathyarchaeota archaeon]
MKWHRYMMRFWYYFRMGYSTYLSFLLGAVNTLTVIYYLLIRNIPDLSVIFPYFSVFVIPAVLLGFPLAVIVGWLHMKGSRAYSSELDISVEANPYAYKLTPGYQTEVVMPLYLKVIDLLARISKDRKLLTVEEESEIRDIQKKLRILLGGGMVGTPRRRPIQ